MTGKAKEQMGGARLGLGGVSKLDPASMEELKVSKRWLKVKYDKDN